MNLSYANQPELYWGTNSHIDEKNATLDASSCSLRFPTFMQPISSVQPKLQSSDQSSNAYSSSFRAYNQFISVPRGLNRLNTSSRSAFKPVGRHCLTTKPDPNPKECSAVPCFCHLPIKDIFKVSENKTVNLSVNEDFDNCTPLNLKINNSNVDISSSQYHRDLNKSEYLYFYSIIFIN